MTEPIDQATKDLIKKEAEEYGYDIPSAVQGYVRGATVWAERLKQEKKESYKIGWRDGYDDFKINDLKEQLKQERNKVIDECISRFSHYPEFQKIQTTLELASLKDKSHE